MAKPKIKLNKAGLDEVKKRGQTRNALKAVGDSIADSCHATADGKELPVDCRVYNVPEGPVAVVAIAHPAGARVEAKRGPLSKAANSRGYRVKGSPRQT